MASVLLDSDGLRITLTTGERWAALRRTDLTAPWLQVVSAEAVAEPFRLTRGLRAPGLALPRRTKIGTWRRHGRRSFVVASKGSPGLRIRLQHNTFAEILASTAESVALAEQINARRSAAQRHPADPAGRAVERILGFPAGGSGNASPITLAGTVLLPPPGTAVRAAAVLITGSGPMDRDADSRRASTGVSREVAQALAPAGIATLRYDKRGIGASGGDYLKTGFLDNINDARSALRVLGGQRECLGKPIFVIGHSEGAMIATALAGGASAAAAGAGDSGTVLDGAVLLAGSAKTGEETLIWQAARINPTLPKAVQLIMKLLHIDPAKQQRKALDNLKSSTGDVTRLQGRRVNAKWFRELLAYDPKPDLAAVTVPVLAITGGKDLQVDPADLDVIASTVGGQVTTQRMPDLTHVLRSDPGEPSLKAYRGLLRKPMDAALLAAISSWITTVADGSTRLNNAASGEATRCGPRLPDLTHCVRWTP